MATLKAGFLFDPIYFLDYFSFSLAAGLLLFLFSSCRWLLREGADIDDREDGSLNEELELQNELAFSLRLTKMFK